MWPLPFTFRCYVLTNVNWHTLDSLAAVELCCRSQLTMHGIRPPFSLLYHFVRTSLDEKERQQNRTVFGFPLSLPSKFVHIQTGAFPASSSADVRVFRTGVYHPCCGQHGRPKINRNADAASPTMLLQLMLWRLEIKTNMNTRLGRLLGHPFHGFVSVLFAQCHLGVIIYWLSQLSSVYAHDPIV